MKLDYFGERVEYLMVNGEKILDTDPDDRVYENHRIRLSHLKKGTNTVKLGIYNKYNTK